MRGDCVSCLMGRILMEIREVDPSKEMEVMEACTKLLGQEFYDGVGSSECATKIHHLAYKLLDADPYLELKKKSNEQALALFPKAKAYVEAAQDPFSAAVLCSIIGNVLDYGIDKRLDQPNFLLNKFDSLLEEGLAVDDSPKIKRALESAKNVAFFPDNAGEIIFDQLLLEQIRKFDVEITMVVKGEAILTDVTMEDVRELRLDKQVDRVIDTGTFAVGFPVWDIPTELQDVIDSADIIISKGMGNFECFTELEKLPVAYLMRTKCKPVSEASGAPYDSNVAIFRE